MSVWNERSVLPPESQSVADDYNPTIQFDTTGHPRLHYSERVYALWDGQPFIAIYCFSTQQWMTEKTIGDNDSISDSDDFVWMTVPSR